MSFNHLIHKPNSRLALDKPDHSNAIVLFDPKTAYASLVDARKTLQKEYEARNHRAVEVDEAVEEAEDRNERARKGEGQYWRAKKRRAEESGLVQRDEEEDPELRREMAEAAEMAGGGLVDDEEEDGGDDEDEAEPWDGCSGEKPLHAYVEDEDEELLNLEPNWSGEQAFDEDGKPVHPALLEKRKQRRQREAEIQSQKTHDSRRRKQKQDLAVQTHHSLPTCEELDKRKDSPGLIPQPWTLEQADNLAQGPIGRGNVQNIGGVFAPGLADAGVAARAEVAERGVLEGWG